MGGGLARPSVRQELAAGFAPARLRERALPAVAAATGTFQNEVSMSLNVKNAPLAGPGRGF